MHVDGWQAAWQRTCHTLADWPDDVVGLEADILSFLRRTSYPTLTGEDGMAKACFCSQLEAQVPGISDLYRMSFVEVLQWL